MKTSTTFKGFMKNLLSIAAVGAMVASCGGSNRSGGGGSSSSDGISGLPVGAQGNSLQYLQVVRQENPCRNQATRRTASFPLQNVRANNGDYIGVSPFGDIAIVSVNNGQAHMNLEICQRAGTSGKGRVTRNPVLNLSRYCPIGEISALDVVLEGYPAMGIAFAPVFVADVYGRIIKNSSVCQGNQNNNQYNPYNPYNRYNQYNQGFPRY